ncbi:hypothetical protein FA95DRAFT_1560108 [Auriscalpium vulgare]|uniref:Uncharacterized protein n=1 Tax=Auriscalpium vulgare TaxID=40419 RepID=A0ACB8RR19_9AGAM|nr:hypothetical protein FA95DRAFT_1560108 [Auriscalpium vulgare]
MTRAMDIFSVVLSAVGTVFMAFSAKNLLPSAQLVETEEILGDTQSLLVLLVEPGLALPANRLFTRYNELEQQFFRLQRRSNLAFGLTAQIGAAVFGGLFFDVVENYWQISALRSDIEIVLRSMPATLSMDDANASIIPAVSRDGNSVHSAPADEGDIVELPIGEFTMSFVGPTVVFGVGEALSFGGVTAAVEDDVVV